MMFASFTESIYDKSAFSIANSGDRQQPINTVFLKEAANSELCSTYLPPPSPSQQTNLSHFQYHQVSPVILTEQPEALFGDHPKNQWGIDLAWMRKG